LLLNRIQIQIKHKRASPLLHFYTVIQPLCAGKWYGHWDGHTVKYPLLFVVGNDKPVAHPT